MKNLLISLQEYGLSEVESKIYLELLKSGSSTVLQIARKAKLNRVTVHKNIDLLENKGLVTELVKGKKRAITAEPPEKLSYLIEQEKWKLKRKKTNLELFITAINDQLEKVRKNTSSNIKYYEGRPSISKLYEKIIREDLVRSIGNLSIYFEVFPNGNDIQKRAFKINPHRKVLDIITINNPDKKDNFIKKSSSKEYSGYAAKFINYDNFNKDIFILRGMVLIISLEKVPSAVTIQSEVVVEVFRLLHDILWNSI